MDLSKLSTEDLMALKAGDLSKVSTEGLHHLKGQQAEPGFVDDRKADIKAIPGRVGNLVAGAVRGAGSIGATLMAPKDVVSDLMDGKGLSLESNRRRREDMDQTLRDFGADTDSAQFRVGKLAGEVAGTAGAGGLVANGARAVGASAPVVNAIASGGFSGGGNALTRAAGGAINGAVTAGLVNPEDAGKGAVVGGVLPGAVQLAGKAGNAIYGAAQAGARRLMQSAIKPTPKQLDSGDANTAIDVLLQYGISPNKEGVNKLKDLIDAKNNEIAASIAASKATIGKDKVLDRLDDVRDVFRNQVRPQKDLSAIESVADDFAAHPQMPLPQTQIPVQQAQKLKQGTYKVLNGKYGEAGSAETEAQKGLARGLKEEIATAVPGIGPLNAEESRLIKTLDVAERRALLEMNKNPVGLTALANNPIAAAGFLADRSAAFKALAARLIHNAAPAAATGGNRLLGAAGNPLLRAAVASEASP